MDIWNRNDNSHIFGTVTTMDMYGKNKKTRNIHIINKQYRSRLFKTVVSE